MTEKTPESTASVMFSLVGGLPLYTVIIIIMVVVFFVIVALIVYTCCKKRRRERELLMRSQEISKQRFFTVERSPANLTTPRYSANIPASPVASTPISLNYPPREIVKSAEAFPKSTNIRKVSTPVITGAFSGKHPSMKSSSADGSPAQSPSNSVGSNQSSSAKTTPKSKLSISGASALPPIPSATLMNQQQHQQQDGGKTPLRQSETKSTPNNASTIIENSFEQKKANIHRYFAQKSSQFTSRELVPGRETASVFDADAYYNYPADEAAGRTTDDAEVVKAVQAAMDSPDFNLEEYDTEDFDSSLFDETTTYLTNDLPLCLPGFDLLTINEDYRLKKAIGKGAFSIIYSAEVLKQELLDKLGSVTKKEVAVKVIKESVSKNYGVEESFNQEVAIMSQFRDHPNFVKFFGYSDKPMAIIMKLYRRGSLSHLIHSRGSIILTEEKWKPELMTSLSLDMASGIQAMHTYGIAHNDIKPANTLVDIVDGKLRVVIADFSLATITSQQALGVKAFERPDLQGGTVPYAPPEILKLIYRNEQPPKDTTSEMYAKRIKGGDIYSLGVVFCEIISRRIPWPDATQDDIIISVLNGKRPQFPPLKSEDRFRFKLMKMITACWSHDPLQRPPIQSVVEFLNKVRLALIKKRNTVAKIKEGH